eukprot:RCo054844
MKIPLLGAALIVVVIWLIPGVVVAIVLQLSANRALNSANEAILVAGPCVLAAHRSIDSSASYANTSGRATAAGIAAMAGVAEYVSNLVLRLHSKAMAEMKSVISSRVSAAEGVTDMLLFAWDSGFLGTCNPDNNATAKVTTTQILQQIVEQVITYPTFFKYIYVDEPNPMSSGLWTDCGWGDDPGYALYTMGSDQKYTCWSRDPRLSPNHLLWQDNHTTEVTFSPESLDTVRNSGVLWVRYIYADDVDGLARPPRLLFSRIRAGLRASEIVFIPGADLEMGFLSELLHRSLVSQKSVAVLVDLSGNGDAAVIAHTCAGVPLFYNDSSAGGLIPGYPVGLFPHPVVQASVAFLEVTYGSLRDVPTAYSKFSVNGTVFLLSTYVFIREGLQLLTWQLSALRDFVEQVSSSADDVAEAMTQGDQALSQMAVSGGVLGKLALETDALAQQTHEAAESVNTSRSVIIAVLVVVMCGSLVVSTGMAVKVVHVVTRVSHEMSLVAFMDVEGIHAVRSSSAFLEISSVQHSFAVMVGCLARYKPFLPHCLSLQQNLEPGFGRFPVLSPTRRHRPRLPVPPSSSAVAYALEECTTETSSVASVSGRPLSKAASGTVSPIEPCSPNSFRFGTVVYINYWGTHRRLRSETPETFARCNAEMLQLAQECMEGGVPVSLFGDRLAVIFQRSAHVVAAVVAARRLLLRNSVGENLTNLVPPPLFSVGIATGKLLVGPTGCAKMMAANVLGGPVQAAWGLVQLATRAEVDILVEEEVMEKARFSFLFTPVAVISGPQGGRPRTCYRVLNEAVGETRQEEWMYALAAHESRDAFAEGFREQLLDSAFQHWRRAPHSVPMAIMTQLEAYNAMEGGERDGCGFLLRCIRQDLAHHNLGWGATALSRSSRTTLLSESTPCHHRASQYLPTHPLLPFASYPPTSSASSRGSTNQEARLSARRAEEMPLCLWDAT